MEVKDRIIAFLKHKKLSQAKFEQIVGLSNGFVSSIGKSIRGDSINKMSAVFPDLNQAWVLLGVGEMLDSSAQPKIEVAKPHPMSEVEISNLNLLKAQWEIDRLKERIEEIKSENSENIEAIKRDYTQIIFKISGERDKYAKEVSVLNERYHTQEAVRDKKINRNTG